MENENGLRTVPSQIGDLASGLARIISEMDEKKRLVEENKETKAKKSIENTKK